MSSTVFTYLESVEFTLILSGVIDWALELLSTILQHCFVEIGRRRRTRRRCPVMSSGPFGVLAESASENILFSSSSRLYEMLLYIQRP